MLVSDFVPETFLKATGEVFDGVSGDEDWLKILSIANRKIDSWMGEPGTDWDSTYQTVDIGTVTATDTFELDETIYRLSNDSGDSVRIVHTDAQYTDYRLVGASQLKRYTNGVVARVGQSLKFPKAFASTDVQFGGTIEVPAFVRPDYLVNDSDEITIDDPNWLLLITAAEWTRNDLTLAQNYPVLLQEANNAMMAMKQANRPAEQQIVKSSFIRGNEW